MAGEEGNELDLDVNENISGETQREKITDSEKKNLIDALKDQPCLWDTSLAIYKDKLKKVEASKKLCSLFNLTIDELKKVLHSLRTSMTREVKRTQQDDTFVSKWKFYKSMEFLKEEILKGLQNQESKEWTEEETEILIEFYRENDCLWNHHLESYRDRDKRQLLLTKLQEQLSTRSIEQIKSQWHSLKTIFDRENKRVEGSKRSGTGTDSVYTPSWKYFKCLIFTTVCKDLDVSTSTLDISTDDGVLTPSNKKPKKKKTEEEVNVVKMQLWKEAINALKTTECKEESPQGHGVKELSTFAKMVEETLLRFNERQRAIAKKRISDVLFEIDIGDEGETTRGCRIGQQRMTSPYYHVQQPLYQPGVRITSPSSYTNSSVGTTENRDPYVSGQSSFLLDLG